MLSYILKVTLGWAICYLLFHFLLRRETFFQLNRWYLLLAALVCLFAPAVEISTWSQTEAVAPVTQYLQPVTIGVEQLEAVIITASSEEAAMDWWQVLGWVYLLGVLLAFAKFGYGLWQIFRLYRQSESSPNKGYRFVSTEADHVPFSFFNHLFWSKKFEVEPSDRAAIVRHEEAHIFQRHSLDVILMELLCVIFWCSPPIYLFKKAVKTNHEYLADEAVLQKTTRKNYGRLLLRQFQPRPAMALSNSLFSSQLKNRIVMMTKTKSTRLAALKYLAGLPILALLFLAFSFTDKPQNHYDANKSSELALRDTTPDGDVYKVVDEMPRFPGCEDIEDESKQKACWQKRMLEFIYSNVKYPEQARKNGIDGIVVASFIVEQDGSISDAEITRSIGGGCDEEVLKVVYMMPNWVPGKQDGENVRVKFNLPVKFKFDSDDKGSKMEVDEMPHFLSGCETAPKEELKMCSQKEMFKFIIDNLKYPNASKEAAVEGMVVASFMITEDGSLTNPKVVKGLDEHCDAEVIRVLNAMPKWAPGIKDGKPRAVEMKLPFKFALPKDEAQTSWRSEAKNLAQKIEVFQIYPNPATDQITVNFKTENGPVTVRVTGLDGKELASMKMEHNGEEQLASFPTGEMPRGNVFVSLVGKKGEILETTKVVLQ